MTKLDEHDSRRRKNASPAGLPSSSRSPAWSRRQWHPGQLRDNCSPEVDLLEIHLSLGEIENRIPGTPGYAKLQRLHESHEYLPRQDLQRMQVSGEPPLMSRQAKHPRARV